MFSVKEENGEVQKASGRSTQSLPRAQEDGGRGLLPQEASPALLHLLPGSLVEASGVLS